MLNKNTTNTFSNTVTYIILSFESINKTFEIQLILEYISIFDIMLENQN
jgi:hypothetical protein